MCREITCARPCPSCAAGLRRYCAWSTRPYYVRRAVGITFNAIYRRARKMTSWWGGGGEGRARFPIRRDDGRRFVAVGFTSTARRFEKRKTILNTGDNENISRKPGDLLRLLLSFFSIFSPLSRIRRRPFFYNYRLVPTAVKQNAGTSSIYSFSTGCVV